MKSTFKTFIGPYLVIPVALSGVCLSLLVGIPMVHAAKIDQQILPTHKMSEQTMSMTKTQDHEKQPGCCSSVQMEHDTAAMTSKQEETVINLFLVDFPCTTHPCERVQKKSLKTPSDHPPSFQPFSLTGTIF